MDPIEAVSIPHHTQRYPTTGDWRFDGGWLEVTVSEMPDERYEQLVAVHEIIEALLCKQHGIKEEDVSAFDRYYEDHRPNDSEYVGMDYYRCPQGCIITPESEPGDDIHACYYKQHQLATSVERMLAAELGVDWNAYEQANLDLYNAPAP